MKFITVIIWNAIEKDVAVHDSLQAAEQYLDRFSLLDGYKYGKDYFIAVMVEQVYVVPDIKKIS